MKQLVKCSILMCCILIISPSITALGQHPKRHSFEIGPEVYYFMYEEHEPFVFEGVEIWDKILMEEEGFFYGVKGAYTYRGWLPSSGEEVKKATDGLTLRCEARYAIGKVDYDGQTWGGDPITISDIDDRTMELRPLIGFSRLGRDNESILYTGFGYRYLRDDLSEFPGGYERESNYYYIPIGMNYTSVKRDVWNIGGTCEFDFLVSGLQKSHLSDWNESLPDIENKQKRGWGLRGSLRIEKGTKANFVIEPFMRLWAIDNSEIEVVEGLGSVHEPENYTFEGGISIFMRF